MENTRFSVSHNTKASNKYLYCILTKVAWFIEFWKINCIS